MLTEQLNVLIIEDNPGYIQLIGKMLVKANTNGRFKLESAECLKDALKRLSQGGVDLALINLNLPDSNGLRTFHQIHEYLPDLPIVVLTEISSHETAVQAVAEGAQDYLTKTDLTAGILVRSLDYAVERRRIEDKLKSHQRELESQIDERTSELKKANEQLLLEIEQRKWAQEKLKRSIEHLNLMLEGTVKAFSTVIENRDPYTAGHQLRVAQLAVEIARKMNISDSIIDTIYFAGVLHDIGKIQIPADILNKPGKLSDPEVAIIRNHPKVSYEILRIIPFPFNGPIAEIVLQHHENIDGTGYPSGLKGDEILLESRILKVADVVESMISDRPYRSARGLESALDEISKNVHTRYDPVVVDTCLKLFSENTQILSVTNI